MFRFSFLSLIFLLSLSSLFIISVIGDDSSDFPVPIQSVIDLDDSSFESRTQAATGQTAGIWFVDFYAPCKKYFLLFEFSLSFSDIFLSNFIFQGAATGELKRIELKKKRKFSQWLIFDCFYFSNFSFSKKLAPVWTEVAARLSGEVLVAQVDATVATSVASRFGIRGFPTIKLFRGGLVYSYSGPRTVDDLVQFALSGYQKTRGENVPTGSIADSARILDSIVDALTNLQRTMINEPLAASMLILIGLSVGFLFALIFFWAIFDRPTREQIERSKEIHRLLTMDKTKNSANENKTENKKEQWIIH